MTERSGLLGLILITLTLSACGSPYDRPDGIAPIAVAADEERQLLSGRDASRGLALSGGGIRAAYFSIGAMKALYDAGWLQQADIISSVSGGNYAAYWLMTAELARGEAAGDFGGALFSDDQFPATICRVMTGANFVPTGRLLASLITGPVKRYHKAIGRSFGYYDPEASITLNDFESHARSGAMPYWIVNATRRDIPDRQQARFEMTPIFMGNPEQKLGSWDDWHISARQAASISGAAMKMLTQRVVSPIGDGDDIIRLYDGGKSENLGFYALTKRPLSNVVVIDAEHDFNRDASALTNVWNYLRNDNVEFDLPAPPAGEGNYPFAKAHSFGHIEITDQDRMDVAYVKMSVPSSWTDKMTDESTLEKGRSEDMAFRQRLRESWPNRWWNCQAMVGDDVEIDPWLTWTAASYDGYMNEENWFRVSKHVPFNLLKSDFPHYTTVDTSYAVDQARAFVAIGYLAAKEMLEAID